MLEVIERGHLYFLYRPRPNLERVHSFDDVAGVWMLLHPYDTDRYRLLALGQRTLPKRPGEPRAAYVDRASDNPDDLLNEFRIEAHRADKDAPGHRLGPGRPAGEGVYALIRHDGGTYFGYALELPETPGEVQRAIGLRDQHLLQIAVRNPAKSSGGQPGLAGRDPDFMPEQLEKFDDGNPLAPVDPPDFLDTEGAEFEFTTAEARTPEDIGVEMDPEREAGWSAEFFSDLHLSRGEHPTEPLFRGEWR